MNSSLTNYLNVVGFKIFLRLKGYTSVFNELYYKNMYFNNSKAI